MDFEILSHHQHHKDSGGSGTVTLASYEKVRIETVAKVKGIAHCRLRDGRIRFRITTVRAHGIGRKDIKAKKVTWDSDLKNSRNQH